MPFVLPLTDTAIAVLKRAARRPDQQMLFKDIKYRRRGATSEARGAFVSRAPEIDKYIAKLGRVPPKNWRIHDIRRTVRSKMGELGIDPHIAERVVNHVGHLSEVNRIYDRYTYEPQMRAALVRWEARLLEIVGDPIVAPVPEREGQIGRVLTALKEGGRVMSCAEIAAVPGVKYADHYLYQMAKRGEIIRIGPDQYLHPDNLTGPIPAPTHSNSRILAALKGAGVLTAPEIVAATGLSYSTVSNGVYRLSRTGEVIKAGYGRYLHPDNQLTSEPQKETTL